jgi:ArsR family transcriptional regulator
MTKNNKEQTNEDTKVLLAFLEALADSTRLELVKLLCEQHEPGALCVNALALHLGVSQSAVSQHMRVLRAAGLVKSKRYGYHVHYFINQDALQRCNKLISTVLHSPGREDTR